MYYVFFLAIVGLFLLFAFIYYKKHATISKFTVQNPSNVQFLSKDDASMFLSKDNDRYVSKMSSADLHARHVKTASEYVNKIVSHTYDFSKLQIEKLQRCAKKADKFLANYVYENILSCKEIAQIPWKFALTDKEYEEGLSHTREDIIFLSLFTINDNIASDANDTNLVSTLIHEKIHIFQRNNPSTMHNIMQKLGYKETDYKHALQRCNPDLNDKVYMNPDGTIMTILYSSSMPSGINDIKVANYTMEHPYEKIAYDIGNEYAKMQMSGIMKLL